MHFPSTPDEVPEAEATPLLTPEAPPKSLYSTHNQDKDLRWDQDSTPVAERFDPNSPAFRKNRALRMALDCLAVLFALLVLVLVRDVLYTEESDAVVVVDEPSANGSSWTTIRPLPIIDLSDGAALPHKDKPTHPETGTSMPNLVVFYIDDQGYNDMGPHSTDLSTFTPHITMLAEDGIWLGTYYAQSICTPSRAALLTGAFPIHTGMQHSFISGNAPWGLDTSIPLLPELLAASAGYRTHMVGKWHLGHFHASYLPQNRGFDTFFGFYSGFEGYFYHTAEISMCEEEDDCFHDLRDDDEPVWALGEYNLFLFDKEVVQLINHYGSLAEPQPFFLYYAPGNLHAPLQVPDRVYDDHAHLLKSIPNEQRRTFAAMTILLDEAVGNMTNALTRTGLWSNTLIVVASDNGGCPFPSSSGSNYPLRGSKGFLWEGGVRVNALVSGGIIPRSARGSTYPHMFHVTDWLPTLIQGVLGNASALEGLLVDGVDHWDALLATELVSPTESRSTTDAPRSWLVYNIDYSNGTTGAIRMGDMKLLVNVQYQPVWAVAKSKMDLPSNLDNWEQRHYLDFLFNLTADPYEQVDLRLEQPGVFAAMKAEFSRIQAGMVPTSYCGVDDDTAATTVFQETQFVGPWITDDNFTCPVDHQRDAHRSSVLAYCEYGLLSEESCEGLIG